jgi:hypothetical protein
MHWLSLHKTGATGNEIQAIAGPLADTETRVLSRAEGFHIFSGGVSTMCLIPDTIRVLMLVKNRLMLAHINLTKKD